MKLRRDGAICSTWGFAEATLFFIVPDVVVGYYAYRDGLPVFLIRMGDGQPVEWRRIEAPDTRRVRGGDLILSRYDLFEESTKDPALRAALVDTCRWSDDAVVGLGPGRSAVYLTSDGEEPDVWLVGLNAAGDVLALVVAHDEDATIFQVRPAE